MKRFLSILLTSLISTLAMADYRMIVPQTPGSGTSVWAHVVAPHIAKVLGEPVIIEHIPGANDVPGFNKFHNSLRTDPKVIMVAHGGNAESFLTDKVDYNYDLYEPIALVNLNIVVSHAKGMDPYKDHINFGSTSGRRPDLMAIVMMACGPKPTVDAYIACYNQRVTFVKGMKPSDARLAMLRGELNMSRETFVSHKKFIMPAIKEGKIVDWFNHGVLDLKTGKIVNDKNFNLPTFEQAYKAKWKVQPKGEFYDSYVLVKNYRDVLQKSLWMGKDNPNATRLRGAIIAVLNDPVAMKAIEEDSGDYEWFVGKDMTRAYDVIRKQVTEKNLKNLHKFTTEGIGLDAVYKPEIVYKAK